MNRIKLIFLLAAFSSCCGFVGGYLAGNSTSKCDDMQLLVAYQYGFSEGEKKCLDSP